MTNSISTRLIIFTLSALLAFAVAEREFNLCAREEKVNNQSPKSCLANLAEESALIKRSNQRLSKRSNHRICKGSNQRLSKRCNEGLSVAKNENV